METRQTALESATELARREGGFRGQASMHEHLAEQGYPDDIVDEAIRVAAHERRQAALAQEQRRQERDPWLRRGRVVAALLVAIALGYPMMAIAGSSLGFGSSVGPGFLLLPVAFIALPAVAAAVIAGAGAGKRVARTGLIVLIVGLPVAMLYGWFSGSDGTVDTGDLQALLIMMAVVAVPSLIGYGLGTSAVDPRR